MMGSPAAYAVLSDSERRRSPHMVRETGPAESRTHRVSWIASAGPSALATCAAAPTSPAPAGSAATCSSTASAIPPTWGRPT
jgi:hypothetical protein